MNLARLSPTRAEAALVRSTTLQDDMICRRRDDRKLGKSRGGEMSVFEAAAGASAPGA
jgi:hypothetical protein